MLATVLVKAIPGAVPLQIAGADGVAVTTGTALTVTLAVNVEPAHELAVGVIVYCSTPPAVLVSVCAIVLPQVVVQLDAPVTVPEVVAAVHVKIVPVTVELKVTLLAVLLQIV